MREKVKKFWLVLPVVVLPFAVFFCWAIGIVGGSDARAQERKGRFNLSLPVALPSGDSAWSKMNFYEQAERDSIRRRLMMKQDPLFQLKPKKDTVDSSAARVNRRLDEIDAMIDVRSRGGVGNGMIARRPASVPILPARKVVASGRDVDRLEQMMQMIKNKDEDDEQMRQLQSVMDKMLLLQKSGGVNMKRGEECADSTSNGEVPLQVYTREATEATSVYTGNRFFGLEDVKSHGDSAKNEGMLAEVEGDQRVLDGQSVRLRFMQDVFVAGRRIPGNIVVAGQGKFRGDRLMINVSSITYAREVLPVALSVFAMDGVEGIPFRQLAAREAAGQVVDRSLQGVNVNGLDAALLTQAGNAAMQAAKGLFKKRQRAQRVQLAAGYPILLINTKSRSL